MSQEEVILMNMNRGLDIVADGLNLLIEINLNNDSPIRYYQDNAWLYDQLLSDISEKINELPDENLRNCFKCRVDEAKAIKSKVEEMYKLKA